MIKRSCITVFAVGLPLFLGAMDAAELPEVLAELDGVPIRREELAAELAPKLAPLELDRDRARILAIVRGSVDDAVCRRLLDAELKKQGIVPSRAVAEEYLAGLLKQIPPLSRGNFERELSPHLDTPDFQLKAAVHMLLERRFSPAMLAVSATEVARYYELNRLRYRLPENWDIGIIRIDRSRGDAAEIAATARARLLQGENFERVAKEVDPEGARGKSPPRDMRAAFEKELASLAAGDVSRVISASDGYYVLLLRGRTAGGERPLAEVVPFIVMEISSAKDSLALKKLLTESFRAVHLRYAPFLDPAMPPVRHSSERPAPDA